MINLLPPEQANDIRYGRHNAVLRIWLISAAAAIVVLILILISGWFYIHRQAGTLQQAIDNTNAQLKAQNLTKVQADAKEITGDIKVINQVLGSEIHFSDLIQTIGQDMPSGAVLSSLKIGKIVGALDLTANAKDYQSAAQVAANLSDPKNGLFTKVDVISVTCSSQDTQNNSQSSIYPCTAILKALFSSEVKTKFLSVPKENHS
jgi:Tfp pilus assembly protein PilN